MPTNTIHFTKVHPSAKLPCRAHHNDAGYDLYAVEQTTILPGKIAAVRTGLQLAAVHTDAETSEVFLDCRSRSGLSMKLLVIVTGTIDVGYRGEIKVVMANLSEEPYTIEPGDRIAQLVIQLIAEAKMDFVEEVAPSTRSDGGFGSSGK